MKHKKLTTIALPLLLLWGSLTAAAHDGAGPAGCRRGTLRPQLAHSRGAAAAVRQPGGDYYKGERHQLVVLAAFADRAFQGNEAATLAYWEDVMNTPGYSEGYFRGSVHDYFYDQSYGQFDLKFDLQYVALADSLKKYRSTDYDDENSQYLVDDVVDVLLTRQIDWSLYDWNGDGYINQLLIIYAGKGSSYGGFGGGYDAVWPHQWWLSDHLDQTTAAPNDYREARTVAYGSRTYTIDSYCAVQEQSDSDIRSVFGTICHEYTHCFGFPDFYSDRKYLGNWNLMDSGNYNDHGYCPPGYSAHERMLMGWLTPTELSGPATVTAMAPLSSSPEAYIVRNSSYTEEYYVVENRQRQGWDSSLPGSGLTVFHIDFVPELWATIAEFPNSAREQHYVIIPASGESSANRSEGWGYPYADNDSLTDTSKPAATLWHAHADGSLLMSKPITQIAIDSEGLASFEFMKVTTGIAQLTASGADSACRYYDLQGRQVSRPRRGQLYIVKAADGTVRKRIY